MVELAMPPLNVRKVCDWLDGNDEFVRMATSPVGVPEADAGATDVVMLIGVPWVLLELER